MPSYHRLSLLLLLCCICPQTDAAAAKVIWLYSNPVTFISNHDVARIKLQGHDPIDLDDVIYHSNNTTGKSPLTPSHYLTFDEVNQWKSGREINIAYSSTSGAVLLDPRSGKYIEIIHGLKVHPLECVYQSKVGGGSTMEMVIAANEIIDLWKLEIARIYDRVVGGDVTFSLHMYNTTEKRRCSRR